MFKSFKNGVYKAEETKDWPTLTKTSMDQIMKVKLVFF